MRSAEGAFELSHVDELVDQMLTTDYMFDIAMPHLPNRSAVPLPRPFGTCIGISSTVWLRIVVVVFTGRNMLETIGQLDLRQSVLDEEFDEAALEEEAGKAARAAARLEAEIADEGRDKERGRSPGEDERYERYPGCPWKAIPFSRVEKEMREKRWVYCKTLN